MAGVDELSTRFTELVGSELPVQLAAMGGVGTTELAAAVVAAGGCGMVPRGFEPAAGPCGVNFLLPFEPSHDEIADAAGKSRVVEFFYGDPQADLVRVVHDEKALAGWQVGSATRPPRPSAAAATTSWRKGSRQAIIIYNVNARTSDGATFRLLTDLRALTPALLCQLHLDKWLKLRDWGQDSEAKPSSVAMSSRIVTSRQSKPS